MTNILQLFSPVIIEAKADFRDNLHAYKRGTVSLIVILENHPSSNKLSCTECHAGSYEDPMNMSSRASPPVLSEKNDQFDRTLKESAKAKSWQSNDFKDVLTGSEDGDGSLATGPEEERSKIVDESKKSAEARAACTSGIKLKSGKLHEASFSSMNALIESCVKYSEANMPILLGDAIGMNLLAGVAAEEMSKSDMVSPSVSL
ncbi:uncharacterized protein [Nicotiana sylvestris]|uniref:Uncharacterized protein LOC104234479 n=1 Tax=Nicotiana sylvestris TaxID=4096 RepID=A0A1U7XHC0_NICSY|nr:PREDICTED: uncharacterized protein LOC104234479 [Nicotiana sylvestris]XP_009786344.1 PREDICTED: uncharacterized protein LOC104234479 [Nicotiana sylvestris]